MNDAIAWMMIGWLAFASVAAIFFIGEPRKPLSPGVVVAQMILNGLLAVGIAHLGGLL